MVADADSCDVQGRAAAVCQGWHASSADHGAVLGGGSTALSHMGLCPALALQDCEPRALAVACLSVIFMGVTIVDLALLVADSLGGASRFGLLLRILLWQASW